MKRIVVILFFAIMALFLVQDVSAQRELRVTIAAGGTGRTNYLLAKPLAEIINQKIPNMEAIAEVTGASVENVRLVK